MPRMPRRRLQSVDSRLADVPTDELGQPGAVTIGGVLEGGNETAPTLRWPFSVRIFDEMRRTDAQTAAILRAVLLPILRLGYRLAGEDVDPRVTALVETELGLDRALERGRARRRRQGVTWRDVWYHAHLSVPLGHMPLEQVYEVGEPTADQAERGVTGPVAHLRKLGPRMPRTLSQINVARDGGLDGVHQWVVDENGGTVERRIPIERLAYFCHQREGADWTGTSLLRASYKHWLIKDRILRVGPLAIERQGMGLPVVYYAKGVGSKSEALKIAKSMRAGEEAGAALEDGAYRVELKGVEGTTRDELPLLRYHDQAIGRNALAMVLDLGHDRGAYSLGETFADLLVMAQESIQDETTETLTEYVIRDLVVANFGEDEPYPSLEGAEDLGPDHPLTEAALQGLAAATRVGLIRPAPELEDAILARFGIRLDPAEAQRRRAEEQDLPGPDEVDDNIGLIEDDLPDTGVPGAAAGAAGRRLEHLASRALAIADRLAQAAAPPAGDSLGA